MKTKHLFILVSSLLLLGSCKEAPQTNSANSSPISQQTTYVTDVNDVSTNSSDSIAQNPTATTTASPTTTKPNTQPGTPYIPAETSSYNWNLDFTQYGSAFRQTLRAKINASGSKTCSYDDLKTILIPSDKGPNGGMVPFYHADTDAKKPWRWQGARGSGEEFNREHVWPNSRGAGKSGPGSDPQMIRPSLSKENSSRGNKFYGLISDSYTFDPASLGYEAARGEAARIIFYVSARYSGMELSNNADEATTAHTMGRLDRLIEWNNKYPVTAQEKRRNENLYSQGFARNPFIDNPEYVNFIWSSTGLRTSAYTPSEPIDNPSQPDEPSQSETFANEYHKVTDLSTLADGDEISVVSGTASMMDVENKVATPWYLKAKKTNAAVDDVIKTNDTLTAFTLHKVNTFYTLSTTKGYLFHYVSETHYSLGIGSTPTNSGSINWNVTLDTNGDATFKGEQNVYLTYTTKYGTFSGSSSTSTEKLAIYKKI